MVWTEAANWTKRYSKPEGLHIIHKWVDALVSSDNAMIAQQINDALGDYYVVNACIGMMKTYITKRRCRRWFADTYRGFGATVRGLATKTKTMPEANQYMIQAYKNFLDGCVH